MDNKDTLNGKVKCLNIQFYIKLHGIVDREQQLIDGAYRIAEIVRESFDADEILKPLGLQYTNHIINYELIDEGTRIEYLRCPSCLKTNVVEEESLDPCKPDYYMECRDCGYQWDDDGECKQGKNSEEIRMWKIK